MLTKTPPPTELQIPATVTTLITIIIIIIIDTFIKRHKCLGWFIAGL